MMAESRAGDALDHKAALMLTVLCLIWGLNAVAIKFSNTGIAPIFCAGLRSVVATGCLLIWMTWKRLELFPGRLKDGILIGFMFGAEFGLLYTAVLYTTASSAWILLYTSPFFHALGAHFFLAGDRLTVRKSGGLVLSFAGILILLSKHLGLASTQEFAGDLLAICASAIWAMTTIYIKRRLVAVISPYHTLFYQTLFSIPILFLLSFLFQETPIQKINGLILLSFAYQAIIIAFISYLGWFFLVHNYSVSRLSAFTFLTPVFATIAGILLLKEPLTLQLIFSLGFVSLGIYIVNRE
ncbi:MAG: DMT family transporter [Desulfobacterales bacterium]|jgi:drug/metabolite transporter (DMT)-like permease|nr:DMT family transporter [Desulfobacterales bacterium]MCK5202580.1 DMT family transporter [Desulfobacterales bacterium]MCK5418445.1 DMT family transporter [Desulfobacterales bacterium]MCK5486471.1 DMT family transporter [Desulfobacterales bacterium]